MNNHGRLSMVKEEKSFLKDFLELAINSLPYISIYKELEEIDIDIKIDFN